MKFLFIIFYFAFLITGIRSQSIIWKGSDNNQINDSRLIRIGDFNNDGLKDVIKLINGSFFVKLCNPDSSGFQNETRWALSDDVAAEGGNYFVGDFDGDGYCDIATSIYDKDKGQDILSVAINEYWNANNPSKFKPSKLWGFFIGQQNEIKIGDFNGDGKADVLIIKEDRTCWVLLSTGKNFLTEKPWAPIGIIDSTAKEFYVGDFNGDGRSDLAIYYPSGIWKIALADTTSDYNDLPGTHNFLTDTIWGNENPNTIRHLIGDFNGDGLDDILNYKGNGIWNIISSGKYSFDKEKLWSLYYNIDESGIYAGDFNGDGISDILSYSLTGKWNIALSENNHEKITAVLYSGLYSYENSPFWASDKRDPKITPVVGWGDRDTVSGPYVQDSLTIFKQIDAMIKSGINLIIFDKTNQFFPPTPLDWGVRKETMALDKMFEIMDYRRTHYQKYIPIAIIVGAEFWGLKSYSQAWPGKWPGWNQQFNRQKKAIDTIKFMYADKYPDIYFSYKGKPLVLVYLITTYQNWPHEPDDLSFPSNFNLQRFNFVSIKYCVGWSIAYDPGNKHRIWWISQKYPPQKNIESMTIMPGTHDWIQGGPPFEREAGDYYINSWKEVIKVRPALAIISDWCNWNEEFAIEGAIGVNGWKDYYGSYQYDWYMQITRAYSYIYQKNKLPERSDYFKIFVKDENENVIYLWSGNRLLPQKELPHHYPVISLPVGWLRKHVE